MKSWAGGSLTLTDCCYRRGPGFALLPDLSVSPPAGESLVCADVDLATGACALSARTAAEAEAAASDRASGTAHIPLYTVRAAAGGGIEFLHDWRGAPELLVYV